MSESWCIDSSSRGRAMPKSYSSDLRERVIEAVESGTSRRETAERFEVSVSSVVKWVQRWHKSAAPKHNLDSQARILDHTLARIQCSLTCAPCRTPGYYRVDRLARHWVVAG